MKVLFIGGTGAISTAVSRLALARGIELVHLNRGRRDSGPAGVRQITTDVHDVAATRAALAGETFDVVVDWIAYTREDIERDLALFSGRVGQFVFISSASAYQKPPAHYLITESTPLHNPFWVYSQNKIACELRLEQAYRETGFPITIVRPSLTYEHFFPIALGGWGCFTLADRIRRGAPIVVHGDGASLWVVTHSDDFAKGFVGLLGHTQAIGHAFHITTDEVLTWDQIYRTIGAALGAEPRMVHIASEFIAGVVPELAGGLLGDKAWSVVFDNTKIKTFVPGFQATIPLREGVRRTLAWFEADPRRMRIDPAVNAELDLILAAYGAHGGVDDER